jgi:hypothetical protein
MGDKDIEQKPGAARKPSRAEELRQAHEEHAKSSGSFSSGFVGCWMDYRHHRDVGKNRQARP